MNGVYFSCHGALIGCNIVGLDEDAVCRNFHSLVDCDHIASQYKVLVDLHW